MILENGDIPVFKNYKPYGASYPFPATLCVSINDVVAHGIPKDQILKGGDVVSLDLVCDTMDSLLIRRFQFGERTPPNLPFEKGRDR
jgi:methionine aminopeptidase